MPAPEVEPTYDELLSRVRPEARPDVAAAKNQRIRLQAAHEGLVNESAAFKARIMVLYNRWGMNPYQIGRLLDMSRTRIKQILELERKRG